MHYLLHPSNAGMSGVHHQAWPLLSFKGHVLVVRVPVTPHDSPFISCTPEAHSTKDIVVIGAGHLHIRNVWGECLRVAAMGKVFLGQCEGGGLLLCWGILF